MYFDFSELKNTINNLETAYKEKYGTHRKEETEKDMTPEGEGQYIRKLNAAEAVTNIQRIHPRGMFGKCPECGKTVSIDNSLYRCRNCGKALEWVSRAGSGK